MLASMGAALKLVIKLPQHRSRAKATAEWMYLCRLFGFCYRYNDQKLGRRSFPLVWLLLK